MLTHRVAYNAHIHIAKNFIALIDALLASSPTVPYAKTFIGDDQIKLTLFNARDGFPACRRGLDLKPGIGQQRADRVAHVLIIFENQYGRPFFLRHCITAARLTPQR